MTEFSSCWDGDRGNPSGRIILCGGLAGSDERRQVAGVGRPLGRKSSGTRGGLDRAG